MRGVRSSLRSLALVLARALGNDWSLPHWRVLCFHDVPPEAAGRFEEYVSWFGRYYEWVSFSAGCAAVREGPLTHPIATLRFDDGWLSQGTVVLPILRRMRIPACLFVVPEYVNRGTMFRNRAGGHAMTWCMVKEWLAAGLELGNHTFSHMRLSECDSDTIWREVAKANDEIFDRTEYRCVHFAYPHGRWSPRSREIIRSMGLISQSTIVRGPMRKGHPLEALRADQCDLSRDPRRSELVMRAAEWAPWLRRIGALVARLQRICL